MTTVTLDDALQARIRAVAAPEEDFQTFIAAAAQEMIARRERRAAEAQAILNGPHHPFDPDAVQRKYQEAYGLSDLSRLSGEALVEEAERLIAAMPAEKRIAMEKAGLL